MPIPLIMFNHPCLFRQAMLATLDHSQTRWRAALTTPSLPAVWAGLRSGLPDLPNIEVRLLRAPNLSRFAERLAEVLREETLRHLESRGGGVDFVRHPDRLRTT
ncbi:MAG: hypothetical protein ACX93U_22175 [Salipiger thiooxidans]|uniref:hypothetical protein n=1 Tax=Salipiger thiooxidans TaxID=282683 RepID=UPI001CFBED55|nr:hypothetical protein [Salipiger thiooxidans]